MGAQPAFETMACGGSKRDTTRHWPRNLCAIERAFPRPHIRITTAAMRARGYAGLRQPQGPSARGGGGRPLPQAASRAQQQRAWIQ